MGVHDGHRQRVMEELKKKGFDDLPPHRVLEYVLFYTIPRRDVNETAHLLIDRFGSLSGVFDARPEELEKVEGVGPNTAMFLSSIPDIARRYLKDKNEFRTISDLTQAVEYFIPFFVGVTEERLYMASLDSKGKVTATTLLAEGSVDRASVSVRKIIEIALRTNAVSVILAHNHPGGLALPSTEDIEMTLEIFRALKNLHIDLLDHVIIADDDGVSLMSSIQME